MPAHHDPVPVPEDLQTWVKDRTELLASEMRKLRVAERDPGDLRRWETTLLDHAANVEEIARRIVHLLTAHSIRNRVLTPTEVAAITGVTTSTAMNRNGSRLGQEVLNELANQVRIKQ